MDDDFDGALNNNEKGVACLSLADDPSAREEIVHDAFLREEGLSRGVDSGQDGDGREGVEESRGGGDHGIWASRSQVVLGNAF